MKHRRAKPAVPPVTPHDLAEARRAASEAILHAAKAAAALTYLTGEEAEQGAQAVLGVLGCALRDGLEHLEEALHAAGEAQDALERARLGAVGEKLSA